MHGLVRLVRLEGEVPVRPRDHFPLVDHHGVAGGEEMNTLEEREVGEHGLEREVLVERVHAHAWRAVGHGKDRLDLRREDQAVALAQVVERLDAEAVAREQEAAGRAVPEAEGKHAVEAVPTLGAVARIDAQEHLGVALRPETLAGGFELRAQRAEVVDLAVVRHPRPARGILHRLSPRGGEIDDREAPVTERHRAVDDHRLVIRTTMGQGLAHASDGRRLCRTAIQPDDARDAAHDALAPLRAADRSDHVQSMSGRSHVARCPA